MSSATRKCRKREDVRQALAFSKAPEARKARLRMADTWIKRGNQTGDYHKPEHKNDRTTLLTGRNRSHLVTSF